MKGPTSRGRKFRWMQVALGLVLATATLWAYADLRTHEFLLYDDNEYVSEHPVIRRGLSWEGIVYVFTQPHHATWHPLTGLSHLLDVTLFGLSAPAHLAVNLAFHIANALLLFALWWRLLDSAAVSFWIAAAFALHPLHVESVAWVSERKDVLSTCLALLATHAYVGWVRQPTGWRWWSVAGWYVAALLAKPMVVTLPLLLLLLDFWPLRRTQAQRPWFEQWWRLAREKTALFVLAFAFGVITIAAQTSRGAVEPLAASPLSFRLANACLAYALYLRDLVWPLGLAVFYPRRAVSGTELALAISVLAATTTIAWVWRRRCPWLWVGWLWYVIALAPVAGLVQAGDQARADRFTYLALTGIFVAVGWQTREWVARGRWAARGSCVAGMVLIGWWSARTAVQVRYWRNTETLFRHALEVTENNHVAHANLGADLLRQGRVDEAFFHLDRALAIRPYDPLARLSLGAAYAARGQWNEALDNYRQVLAVRPNHVSANFNAALVLMEIGQRDAARQHLEVALREDPHHSKAWVALGRILLDSNERDPAIAAYRRALEIDPRSVAAHAQLAVALEQAGNTEEALVHYREVTRLVPQDARAWFNLAAALRDAQRLAQAKEAFAQALAVAERTGEREVAARVREALGQF
ncbi:MAG: O-GlcNAc transferase [Candidatus Binatia bacterium]|nr:MAG: O-GlcNAc transferase [Candidatus Binatia bacterium]